MAASGSGSAAGSVQMRKDGLVPIAMADKDGWPAQGTFDIINLRLNGYDFHMELLNGKQGLALGATKG
jgi:multiple sugar transport system substrate-binding protein